MRLDHVTNLSLDTYNIHHHQHPHLMQSVLLLSVWLEDWCNQSLAPGLSADGSDQVSSLFQHRLKEGEHGGQDEEKIEVAEVAGTWRPMESGWRVDGDSEYTCFCFDFSS